MRRRSDTLEYTRLNLQARGFVPRGSAGRSRISGNTEPGQHARRGDTLPRYGALPEALRQGRTRLGCRGASTPERSVPVLHSATAVLVVWLMMAPCLLATRPEGGRSVTSRWCVPDPGESVPRRYRRPGRDPRLTRGSSAHPEVDQQVRTPEGGASVPHRAWPGVIAAGQQARCATKPPDHMVLGGGRR